MSEELCPEIPPTDEVRRLYCVTLNKVALLRRLLRLAKQRDQVEERLRQSSKTEAPK